MGTKATNFCACGCGQLVAGTWARGHRMRAMDKADLRARLGEAMRGRTHSPEAREKMRTSRRRFIASGGQVWNKGLTKDVHPSVGLHNQGQYQSAADHYDRSFPTTSTRPECVVQIALYERGIPFLFNVPVRHICRPDFILPDARIAINVDAAYWHRGREDKDTSQDATLQEEGWLVFRWSEDQIKRELSALLDQVAVAYRTRLSEKSRV
jgi:very-short-patch-repair endonuclease